MYVHVYLSVYLYFYTYMNCWRKQDYQIWSYNGVSTLAGAAFSEMGDQSSETFRD